MEMLTKEQYKELAKEWIKHGRIYQKYVRYCERLPMLLEHINVFAGKDVLEIGSNAGLCGYHLADVAKSYTGVERENWYFKQARETLKRIENKNAQFLNCSIKTFIKRHKDGRYTMPINACYLSFVLYHFENKEVQMFADYILPKLDVIIVQSRAANRNVAGRTKHNDYNMWDCKAIKKYLEKNGFTITKLLWADTKKFHFIIGEKTKVEKQTVEKEPEMIIPAIGLMADKILVDTILTDSKPNIITESFPIEEQNNEKEEPNEQNDKDDIEEDDDDDGDDEDDDKEDKKEAEEENVGN